LNPRRLLFAVTAFAVGASALGFGAAELAGAMGDTGTNASSTSNADAAGMLEQALRGNVEPNYTGDLVVRWVDDEDVTHEEQASVASRGGVMQISDQGRVVAASPTGLVLDGSTWSTKPAAGARGLPNLAAKYTVESYPGGKGPGGGPTTILEAHRKSDGALVERVSVDNKRGLVLQRESFEANGDVDRAIQFTHVAWLPTNARASAPSATTTSASSSRAHRVKHVGEPYRAPAHAGNGFQLVSRWRHPGSTVQLSYSDGLLSASVFEQPGELNWNALPSGGVVGNVGGRPAVAYSLPVGDVVVWERAGIVYTAVGDVPRAELVALGADVSRRADNGTLTRLASVVLEPFRW
jgi:hypothetical protein